MVKPRIVAASLAAVALFVLCACDLDPFGLSEKKIGAGYRLYMAEDGGYAIFSPGASSGPGVARVGWRRPFIVAVTHDGDWEVFDTSSGASQLFLKAEQVQADSRIRDIGLLSPDAAWKQLSHYRSQW